MPQLTHASQERIPARFSGTTNPRRSLLASGKSPALLAFGKIVPLMSDRIRRAVAGGLKDAGRIAAHMTAGCFLVHAFWTYGFTIRPTAGASMIPNMPTFGAAVLISKQHRRGRNIEVGDLVSLDHPMKLGESAVKRVIGMPGDFVLRDTPGKGDGIMLQVPEGHIWVAGDNQSASRDSRIFGPIPLALVRGKVLAQVYPFKDSHWFKNGLQEPEADLD